MTRSGGMARAVSPSVATDDARNDATPRRRKPRLLLTGATPLDALLPSWQRSLRARNAPTTTQNTYRIAIERFVAYLHREQRSQLAGEVTRDDVEGFVEKLLELEYAASTARLWLTAVQAFFRWLVEQGELAVSPAEHIASPQLPERDTRTLTEDEAKRLLRACHGDDFAARRDEALIRLALDSGMRESELASIRMDALDLDVGALRIEGKGRRERVVAFGAKTSDALDRYLRARRAHRCADLPWLWIGHHGRMTAQGVYWRVTTRGREAGLGHVRPHMLRHTWSDLCQRNGMQWADLKQLGGWKSDSVAWKYGASLRAERAVAAHRQFGPGDRL